jgi:tRNA(fMet)-specific endonuclease VapC
MRRDQRIVERVQAEQAIGNETLIAPIAYYEVKRGLMAINAQNRLREFYELCDVLGIGQLDNTILDIAAEIYIELRGKKRTVEDADILTAAFCKKHNFTLVTHMSNILKLFQTYNIVIGCNLCLL